MKNLILILSLFTFSCSSNSLRTYEVSVEQRKQLEAFAPTYMISTQGVHTSEAGLAVLKKGGNIFDAAAAISFAIAVERPQSTGIGGGGFFVIDGPEFKKPRALDFRERAPARAHEKMYLDKDGEVVPNLSLDGSLSVGVPGMVYGVLEMHKQYGKLSRNEILAPAIALAKDGFKVYKQLEEAIEFRKDVLEKFAETRNLFIPNGKPLKEGDVLVQADLAKTLQMIAKYGNRGFYNGYVANQMVKELKKLGGIMSRRDLEKYHSKWREPVSGDYKGYQIYSMPPPSSGGTHVVQILNIVEPLNLKQYGPQSVETIHQTATAMQMAFVDRARYLGDPDYVKVPVSKLTDKHYAKELSQMIGHDALKIDHEMKKLPYESDQTTHFTVMDSAGNVVSSTQTINYVFGSGIVIPKTGIVMNDEMDDFSNKPGALNVFGAVGSEANKVEAGKRPLSSMSPTIVKKDGKLYMALGTPSGTRILTCVAQVLLNHLEHGLPLYESVAATRFHHQWQPDQIRIGEPYFNKSVMRGLEKRGHKIEEKSLGCQVQAISFDGKLLHGVSDPRGIGLSVGL